jgi:hypothetical protein
MVLWVKSPQLNTSSRWSIYYVEMSSDTEHDLILAAELLPGKRPFDFADDQLLEN